MLDHNKDAIDIWNIDITAKSVNTGALLCKLCPSELLQVESIRHPQQQHRFTISHAAMRDILSRYSNMPAADIPITRDQHGKPRLDHLYFNLSHSRDQALLAVCNNREIGIDIEYINQKRKILGIAQRFFSAQEFIWLQSQQPSQQIETFFHIWCMKEAYLKGIGLGLKGGLSSLIIDDASMHRVLTVNKDNGDPWCIELIDVPEGYTAAVAYTGDSATINRYQWEPDQQ